MRRVAAVTHQAYGFSWATAGSGILDVRHILTMLGNSFRAAGFLMHAIWSGSFRIVRLASRSLLMSCDGAQQVSTLTYMLVFDDCTA